MTPPTVIHIRNAPDGWEQDPNYVYIGRGSRWGNPFSHKSGTKATTIVASRDEACDHYREHVLGSPHLMQHIHLLASKTLVCFCVPKRCHGNELVKIFEEWYA